MNFRMHWRVKASRKTGCGVWQPVRDGIEEWVENLNKASSLIMYWLEYGEPVPAYARKDLFNVTERDGL